MSVGTVKTAGGLTMDADTVLKAYTAVWSEPDAGRRAALLDICWSDDSVVIGPGFRLQGRRAVLDDIDRVQRGRPGLRALATSGFDGHDGWVRFTFDVIDAEGRVVDHGWDLVELAADGRIARVVSFFGPLPEPAPLS